MNSEQKRILEMVKKLLTLSEGTDFENESVTALGKARDLLAKYNLKMSDAVAEKQEVEEKEVNSTYGWWQSMLAIVIADYMACSVLNCRGRHRRTILIFVGMPNEVEVCTYMYESIFRQIKKLAGKRQRKVVATDGKRFAKRFIKGYKFGIITFLKDSFEERKFAEAGKAGALVLVRNPKVDDYMDQFDERKGLSIPNSISPAGYNDGVADGHKINVNEAISANKPNGFIEKEN